MAAQTVKNLPVWEIWAWSLGLGRSPGERNGNPLQYSCLENPTDRGAWWATVHGVHKELHTTQRLTLSHEHKTYYVKFICSQSMGCRGFIFNLTNYWFFLEISAANFLRIKTFQMPFWWKWILCQKCPWIFKIYRKICKDRYYSSIICLLFWETITFFLHSLMKSNKISKQYTTKRTVLQKSFSCGFMKEAIFNFEITTYV